MLLFDAEMQTENLYMAAALLQVICKNINTEDVSGVCFYSDSIRRTGFIDQFLKHNFFLV